MSVVANNSIESTSTQVVSRPLLKLKLLDSLRQGNFEQLKLLIESKQFQPLDDPTISGVLSLMLNYAIQVSPMSLIKDIVNHSVNNSNNETDTSSSDTFKKLHLNINQQDSNGNTPLHLACLQSRGDVVSFFMDQSQINDCVLNNQRLQPIEVCKNLNIAQMMQYKRSTYVGEIAQEFRTAFNNRDFGHLETILGNPRNAELLDINGTDPQTGDTVLHEFVKKRDIIMCRWLLEHGADPFKRDITGVLPIEILGTVADNTATTTTKAAIDLELKKLLTDAAKEQSVVDVNANFYEPPSMRGYLSKWTNFAQGYRLRWFVLSGDGILSYYKDQADTKNACRGSLNLSKCSLHLDSSEKLKFEIYSGKVDEVRWHLKGNHSVETNKWVWAIQGAIRYAKDRERMLQSNHVIPSVISSPSNGANLKPHEMTSETSQQYFSMKHKRNISKVTTPIAGEDIVTLSGSMPETNDIALSISDSIALPMSRMSSSTKVTEIITHSVSTDAMNEFPNDKNVDKIEETTTPVLATTNDDIESYNSSDDEEKVYEQNVDITYDGEDIKNNYGPFAEKLEILQNTISMELLTLSEFLKDMCANSDDWHTLEKSLNTLISTSADLNTLTKKRDDKLLKILSKQKNVNNIWIQSVKELELELFEKTERLDSLENERKQFKKMITTKMNDSGSLILPNLAKEKTDETGVDISTESDQETSVIHNDLAINTALEEVSKYIKATTTEDQSSDGDEFYDAEDLVEASENIPDDVVLEEEKEEFKKHDELKNVVSSTEEVTEESSISTVVAVKEISSEIQQLEKQNSYKTIGPKTKIQRDTELKLLKESSFVGYEDGVRTKLELDSDNRPSVSLWSVMKSMVGKDLSRIALPVTFNEPSSMLQRVAEDLEYSELLDQAAKFEDSTLRLLYVAVFSTTPYSSTIKRVAKPFNPLLGETFEYSRPDKNYRFLSEQVSHHPVISAFWAESPKWDMWGSLDVESNFNGRTFAFKQKDFWHLKIRPDCSEVEDIYTWKKPENILVGILIGSPEIDSVGDVKITNHVTGDYCILHYKARGWRSSGAYEVRGEVYNASGEKKWVLGGHWNEACFAKKVTLQNLDDITLDRNASKNNSNTNNIFEPKDDGSKFLVWKVNKRPEGPFNLTSFAISLNALQPNLKHWLSPTDTRLRPDQRAMEDGKYDYAAEEKHRLEEKQRAVRKLREENSEVYEPRWFKREFDPYTNAMNWKFVGDYWSKRKEHQLTDEYDIF
ncbi:hypothetical protein TPHA_0H00770 [Tetrapisispora phaffii CBS 4417]|uniref:PH domain-containing protein n=1 Tax=Tetrapisispora phaffii (strain ATCC 24235 / CBS 4417 / NBRC 1672 / NRRL Y-8282 / UCD 70-5) TaxID=1071381 RepID=G8BWY3_TETPH|nr:hypothetical protein TPHA_0H00770 [Tetrapisispora phaffii CBS 4417]CCE64287.1 hypothetical protein TPHA_0H00770 [Tetrapisispora phaffii CBS 4417]